ncbi:hypothetical protein PoB_005904500 [Plakobranchus ocellatus]|uniref:PLAT domain-containing protein n=1 Tax=Plakobranchus ocellatus TaxID=259542 RepID=A0AAV4CKW4_9GAST|nr:hypothetical protein PoB_005904500 [Plakobranchus ocellatus]
MGEEMRGGVREQRPLKLTSYRNFREKMWPILAVVDLEKMNVSAFMFRTSCRYFLGFEWRRDDRCQSIPVDKVGVVKCHCYVDAPYTVRIYGYDGYKTFLAGLKDYPSTSTIPATFVLIVDIIVIFYCYWAYFQDIQEKDCSQIHVVKDMYKPQSPEQYLVCICTGALPGSGTNKRVSFLLVGETGSLQTVTPEGRFCFSTGSEIWFLLSSDLEIGHILGLTVNYDRNVCGTALYPWFLRRVIVYSKRFNYVIKYDANRTLGFHLPSLVLPSLPYKNELGDEISLRFWRIMKTYHLLASVMFHVPGKGVSKFLCAIASLTAVMASAAIGIEVFGAPTKALYEQQLRVYIGNAAFIDRFLYLSGITCCLSLFIKILYTLIYYKPIGLVWYSKPQYRHDGKRDSQVIKTETETWLTNKKPLPYEPEIHPYWLLRRMYFPYRESALFTSKEERSDVDGVYAVSPGADRESGIIHFGTKHILETPRISIDSTEASFARHSIQKEDDGTFSMIEPISLRSSLGTASEASKSPKGSVVKSEIATDGMLKTPAEPKETTIEQPVKGKAKSKLLQGVSEVVGEDRNKNRDDSGLDDSGHENYQRNCASSQSNVSCSVSRFIHLPRRVKNTSKRLTLNSESSKKDVAGRENLDSEQSDICQSRSSLRSVSEVNFVDADEQGISNVALCPLSPYNMTPSRLTQPYVSSFRFSRGVSYFDKLMKNQYRRSDKEFLHERSTDVRNSPDSNYSLSDLTADRDHLRCLKAASKSVGVDEDACLGTDTCSDTNTFSDVSHGWSETNSDTFKTGFIYGGKRKHDAKGTRCPLSVAAVGKCLIHSFCCIFRFILLIASCMSRRTKNRKENSLAGIRLDELCTPPNLNRTPQEASYSLRRIGNSRQEGQGQNYCGNWTTDSDTNYSARDQVENREKILKGSSVDETDIFGRTPLSGSRSREGHYKSPTERAVCKMTYT